MVFRSKNKYSSAQGTMEYVILLGVVLVIALIAVGTTFVFINPAPLQQKTSIEALKVLDISISDTSFNSSTGEFILKLKNNFSTRVIITNIKIGDSNFSFDQNLLSGASSIFIVPSSAVCSSNEILQDIVITFESKYGLPHLQTVKGVSFECNTASLIQSLKFLYLSNSSLYQGIFSNMSRLFDLNYSLNGELDNGKTLPEGLVAYYKFNESSGTTVVDSSGNNKTGVSSTAKNGVIITTEGDYTVYTFTSSGTFTPSFSGDINVHAWGAGGAGGTVGGWVYGSAGGAGGAARGIVNVTSGVSYPIVVGGGGVVNSFTGAVGGGAAASNNNNDNRYSGGGGGYSGLFLNSVSQSNALLIAGGGGGGGSSRAGTGNAGGSGGGTSGQVGYSPYDNKSAYGGNPGTQSSAGASVSCDAISGGGGQGALQGGVTRCHSYGGGGGGGYFGGSGGGYSESNTMGGGGGGSGYFNPSYVSSATLTAGVGTTVADSSNSFRGSAGTAGDVASNGSSGVVVIKFLTSLGSVSSSTINGLWGTDGMVFNGTSDCVISTSGYKGPQSIPFSISLWFKTNYNPTSYPMLVSFGQANSTNVGGIMFHDAWPGILFVYAGQNYLLSKNRYDDGQWHQVVFSIDASNFSTLYVDGVLDNSSSLSSNFTDSGPDLSIGCSTWNGYNANFFKGSLEDVAIFNRALSSEEINSMYNFSFNSSYITKVIDTKKNTSNFESVVVNPNSLIYGEEINPEKEISLANGLVGLWHLNESSGTNVSDSSGNGNDGTKVIGEESSGVTITTDGDYTIVTFKDGATFTPSSTLTDVEVLIVAGGGGGGTLANGGRAGGGGAGGLLYYGSETPKTPNGSALTLSAGTSYEIQVGNEGTICSSGTTGNGENSRFGSYTAIGGGGGSYNDWVQGHNGGSGGGDWYYGGIGSGTDGQGNSGGYAYTSPYYGGGGGGGAGTIGGNGSNSIGGNGGDGLQYSITGTPTYYAGGGSSDVWPGVGSHSPGTPGLGGGGTGDNFSGGTNGTDGLGGGGGSGAAGGSGVVIVRYLTSQGSVSLGTKKIESWGSSELSSDGLYTIYTFKSNATFTTSNDMDVEVLVVAGGGGGGSDMGGGGGGGGVISNSSVNVTSGVHSVIVGAGGSGAPEGVGQVRGSNGGNSIFGSLIAIGGGGGASNHDRADNPAGDGGSGGGASGGAQPPSGGSAGDGGYGGSSRGLGTFGQGNDGSWGIWAWYPGGGGGAGAAGSTNPAHGGAGIANSILGPEYYWGGGGGGSGYSDSGGNGGIGGGGGGAVGATTGGAGLNNGSPGGGGYPNSQTNTPGGNAGANTGGGGGGGSHYYYNNKGGDGGSGIVIIKVPTSSTQYITITSGGLWGTNGMNFDGVNDYVKVLSPPIQDFTNITISAWVKANTLPTPGNEIYFINQMQSGRTADTWRLGFYNPGDGAKLMMQTYSCTSTAQYTNGVLTDERNENYSLSPSIISPNTWYYVTQIMTGCDGLGAVDLPLGIGYSWLEVDGETPANFFNGSVEEVSIWNRALSSSEVQDLFSKGTSRIAIQARSCTNSSCTDSSWSAKQYGSSDLKYFSLPRGEYFQFKITMDSYNINSTPKITDLNIVFRN